MGVVAEEAEILFAEVDLEVDQLHFFMDLELLQPLQQMVEMEIMELLVIQTEEQEEQARQGHWFLYEIFFS
jgi:phosphoribosylanthranilate isomerase